MGLCWISVHVVLLSIMCSFTASVRASPCAEVHSPSTMVLIGSTVKASCHIKEDCPLTKGRDFSVAWPYKASLSYSNMDSQDKRVSEILISNFTNVTVMLECAICRNEDCRVVAGLEIKSASPPPSPRNLACVLNLTDPFSWLCTWDLGQETSRIPTNYTLHTEIKYIPQKFVYVPAPGKHFYRVPREGFALFSEVKVQVVAVNALGQATSEPLVLDPMETVKLDPPEVQWVGAEKNGCLGHRWSLSAPLKWISKPLFMEIKLKPKNDKTLDREKVISGNVKSGGKVRVCGLLYGMRYQSEMRVRYRNSSWSEWSQPTEATTLITAPTGRLVTWLKLSKHPTKGYYQAELFWKPSLQFRPNSMNVSYIVSLKKLPTISKFIWETYQQHYSLRIPVKTRKIYLMAKNLAGISNPTEVAVYRHTEQYHVPYLKVVPESEESVYTEWSSPVFSAVSAYVLEWKTEEGTSFEVVDKNQSSMVISGLEPYKPYNISVYPKYKDAIGQPYTSVVYTKQKAPSESPKLQFGDIRPSSVELFWDEIPLQQRNGIITNYSLFYWDDKNKNDTRVLDINGTERHVVLKDLHSSTIYDILLLTSTIGGSVNGSIVTVKTPSIDAFEIVLIVIPACVGLVLLLFGVFTCVSNHECWKTCLWPVIPDAANSSIKKWTSDLLDMPPFNEVKDPMPVYLSHFSLLSLSEKELWKDNTSTPEYPHCGKWPYDDKSVKDHSDSYRDSGIYNSGSQTESVPYATVVFANPYRNQTAPPPAYLRSESTQPLLSEEEPSSPPPCEKMSTQIKRTEQDLGIEDMTGSLWQDFPMLKSLEINSIHDKA